MLETATAKFKVLDYFKSRIEEDEYEVHRQEYKLKNIDCSLVFRVWLEKQENEEDDYEEEYVYCEILSTDAKVLNAKGYKFSMAYKDDLAVKGDWKKVKPLEEETNGSMSTIFFGKLCSSHSLSWITRASNLEPPSFKISVKLDIEKTELPRGKLASDFGELFKSEKYTDFTIHADGQKFRCHKLVLTTRSSVFDHMLSSGMLESQNSEVFLTDISPNTVSDLLSYLYTDNVDNLPSGSKARDLLPVAEKYDLDGLKNLCGEALTQQIDLHTVVDLALLSDMYNVENLRTSTVRYIVENKGTLLNNPTWKASFKDSPSILIDIIEALV